VSRKGLREPRGNPIPMQQSAEVIVSNADEQARKHVSSRPTDAEGPNGARKGLMERESRALIS